MSKVDHETWKGKNRFIFRGKFMTGPKGDNITLLGAYGGVVIALAIYTYTLARYLSENVGTFVSLIPYGIWFTAVYYMLKTTFTDPGVIPRGNLASAEEAMNSNAAISQDMDYNDEPLIKQRKSDETTDRILEIQPTKESVPDISLYRYRYCSTCKIMRPPKASHCSDCDNCVKGFDHHCYFVGNCVGRRNHKFFFLFLFWAAIYCLFTVAIAAIGLVSTIQKYPEVKTRLNNNIEYWIISITLIIGAFIFCKPRFCQGCKYTTIALGLITALVGFIVSSVGVDLAFHENPGVFVAYIIAIAPFALWIIGAFCGNAWGVSHGITFKEKVVIEREVLDQGRRKNMFDTTLKEKIANIREFFAKPQIESHIRGVH